MIAILIILLLLALLYVLSTVCRKNHDGVRLLEGHAYAHRGLHGEGSPENSIEAFGKAVVSMMTPAIMVFLRPILLATIPAGR